MMDRSEIAAYIRGVPDEVAHLFRGLSEEEVRRRPAQDEWSLLELACHLRDSAIEEGLRARRMVEEDNPTLEPYDPDRRAVERDYAAEDPARALTAVRAYLTGYAYQLERFTDEEWERAGVHPERGPVTVLSRAEEEVEHIRDHLEQMRRVRRLVDGGPAG